MPVKSKWFEMNLEGRLGSKTLKMFSQKGKPFTFGNASRRFDKKGGNK